MKDYKVLGKVSSGCPVVQTFSRWLIVAIVVFCGVPLFAQLKSNLLADVNGHFEEGLDKWVIRFDNHTFQKGNEQYLSVVADGGRKHVLKMVVSYAVAFDIGQGVHAYSTPVRIDSKKRYRLYVTTRTTGVDARIYAYGKKYNPGVKSGTEPTYENTRNVFKGPIMSFSKRDGIAQFSNVPKSWTTGFVDIPPQKLTKQAYQFWRDSRFLEVHLVGIGDTGSFGADPSHIFFDDIRIEELNDIKESDITESDYAVKGIDPGYNPNTGKTR